MKLNNRFIRGATLMETLVATAISAGVMGTAVGVYVKGTTGFYGEQSHSYMQFRTRTALDRITSDARGCSGFLSTVTIGGTTYTASAGPSPAACLILKVPSQDSHGLMYYGSSATTPNALVCDTVVYYYTASDKTLRRTVSPAVSVATNDAFTPRTSYRLAETGAVVAQNVNAFTLTLKDHDGAVVSSPGPSVATMGINAQILGTGASSGESPVTVSGVRLRNVRGATISGLVKRGTTGVSGVPVQAVYTNSVGAYPAGTIVATATSTTGGTYQISGLMEGTYSVQALQSGSVVGTTAGVAVLQEADTASTNVSIP